MERLGKKLRSESGASILLGLLIFLVCVMVGSSVFAAAASNAGKAKSNRVEQQKYLTLSSAIQLVADEIQQADYTGRYKRWLWDVTTTTVDKTDPLNPVTTEEKKSYFYCEQISCEAYPAESLPKTYSCGDLTAQLSLEKELDGIFRQQFTDKDGYQGLADSFVEDTSAERELTVTLPEGLPGYPADLGAPGLTPYQASRAVKVKVKLDHATKHILLTAWLDDGSGALPADGKDTMIAELKVAEGTAPLLDSAPGGRLPLPAGETHPTADSTTTEGADPVVKTIETKVEENGTVRNAAGAPMKWELSWIKKGAA